LNFEPLLRPIEQGQSPCGEDMIFSSEFDEIQEARRYEDPSLSQGEWVTEVKEADWEKVIRACQMVLANQAKDLRIAAWLTEAKGKMEGLAGLADGYALIAKLCDAFWDDIHPQMEDGDAEQRSGVLDWLVGQTARLIRETPLTTSSKGRFSLIDQEFAWATAKNIERNPALAEEIGNAAHVTNESFEAALKDTPRQHFVEGMQNAEQLKSTMTTLQAILVGKMGDYAPAFGPAFDTLDDVFRFFRRQVGEVAVKEDEGKPVDRRSAIVERQEPTLGPSRPDNGVDRRPIQSREQAIRQLKEIADFFSRTEPHSPVAYLANKAAKWGAMSLHEWLRTVVKDDAALLRMEELLGVENASGES